MPVCNSALSRAEVKQKALEELDLQEHLRFNIAPLVEMRSNAVPLIPELVPPRLEPTLASVVVDDMHLIRRASCFVG